MSQLFDRKEIDIYLLKIRQGDRTALSSLYDKTEKVLYSVCYSYLHNKQSSEDALADTFVSIVKYIDKYKGKNGFNWIYTIAKNICLNILRSNKKTVETDFYDEETVNTLHLQSSGSIELEDESGILAISKKVLDSNEFKIVLLHTQQELKFKDIAKMLDNNENTVRWQYNNAIKKVKEAYIRSERDEK